MFIYFQYYAKKTFDFVKKVFIVFAVYIVIISLFYHFGSSGKKTTSLEDPMKKSRAEIYTTINNPELTKTDGQKTAMGMYRWVMCTFIGEACADNPDDPSNNFKHSLLGFTANLITIPYANPPASGAYWAYSGLQNAGFVPKSYAAEGIGFASLAPFQEIWKIFRNFVFMIMVLIIVAIGFMIMFRTKINQQTVISIENSLPRIVVALLLITFSYPIAGLMIDFMYISIGFIVLLFTSSDKSVFYGQTDLWSKYFYQTNINLLWVDFSPLGSGALGWSNAWKTATALFYILPEYIQGAINTALSFLGIRLGWWALNSFFLSQVIPSGPGRAAIEAIRAKTTDSVKIAEAAGKVAKTGTTFVSLLAGLLEYGLSIGIGILAGPFLGKFLLTLILFTTIIFIYFRIFFMLLSVYINTLILIIFSPVILAAEAIPGKSSFGSWIKNIALNLSTFPLVVLFILLSKTILTMPLDTVGTLWKPPYLVSIDPAAFQLLIGGSIIFMIPDLIKTIKQLSGVKPLPIDLGIGSLFAGTQAAYGGAAGTLGQIGSISLGMGAIKGMFGKKRPEE